MKIVDSLKNLEYRIYRPFPSVSKHISAMVYGRKIISSGINMPGMHAEMSALQRSTGKRNREKGISEQKI